jgi:hypothetical protein
LVRLDTKNSPVTHHGKILWTAGKKLESATDLAAELSRGGIHKVTAFVLDRHASNIEPLGRIGLEMPGEEGVPSEACEIDHWLASTSSFMTGENSPVQFQHPGASRRQRFSRGPVVRFLSLMLLVHPIRSSP